MLDGFRGALSLIRHRSKQLEVVRRTLNLLTPLVALDRENFARTLNTDFGLAYVCGVLECHVQAAIAATGALPLGTRLHENMLLEMLFDSLIPGQGKRLRDRSVRLADAKEPEFVEAMTAGVRETASVYKAMEDGQEPSEVLPSLMKRMVRS